MLNSSEDKENTIRKYLKMFKFHSNLGICLLQSSNSNIHSELIVAAMQLFSYKLMQHISMLRTSLNWASIQKAEKFCWADAWMIQPCIVEAGENEKWQGSVWEAAHWGGGLCVQCTEIKVSSSTNVLE